MPKWKNLTENNKVKPTKTEDNAENTHLSTEKTRFNSKKPAYKSMQQEKTKD